MKTPHIPTKRQPVSNGVFRRFHSITTRKQRVAATAPVSHLDHGDTPGLGVGRALVAILLLHVIAIGGIIYHYYVLDGRNKHSPGSNDRQSAALPVQTVADESQPKPGKGDTPYLLKAGDSYQSIALAQNVNEQDLRAANNNAPARAGRVFRLPPKKSQAADIPNKVALHNTGNFVSETPEVPEVEVTGNVPKAILVHPTKGGQEAGTMQVANQTFVNGNGHTCVVVQGDSIWRIASRYKITMAALMKANGITDPRKIRPGMKLVIPANH